MPVNYKTSQEEFGQLGDKAASFPLNARNKQLDCKESL